MVYPAGSGIPVVSSGTSWGTTLPRSDLPVSITDFGGGPLSSAATNSAAFASAAAVNGRVYIPGTPNCLSSPGSCSYVFTWPLVIPANVSVYGDGPSNTVLFSNSLPSYPLVSITGSIASLVNVGVVCGASAPTGIAITNGNGVMLENVFVTYCTTAGLAISGINTDWITISNSYFGVNPGDGITITQANAVMLTDNTIVNNNGGHGVNISASAGGVNFACVSCSIQNDAGTDFVGGNGSNDVFVNAYFESGLSGGHLTNHAMDLSGTNSVHVTGATRFKNYQSAIYASTAVTGLVVDGATEFNVFGLGGTNYTVSLSGSASMNVTIGPIVDDQSIGMNLGTVPNLYGAGSGQIDLPAFQICITAGCGSEVSATRYPVATTAGITLTDCSLNLAIPPTGSSVIVDIQTAAGVSIFGATKLVFTTAGTATTVVHQTTFSGMPLALDTLLKAVVTQNDSNGVAQFGYVRCH
jgi:hypothetical protein